MISDGVFPAVAIAGGLGTLALRQGDPRVPGWLVLYRFPSTDPNVLTELARFGLPAGSPCFPGLYVLDGLLWLAYHDGQRQRLGNMSVGTVLLDVDGLSNPSAFGAGYFAYTEPIQPYRVHRLNLRTGEADQPRLGAPTGLSRIDWRGDVVTIDEDRHALPGATIPSFAGIQLAVGEGPNGGVVWESYPGTDKQRRGLLWPGLDSFTPKCAADGDTLAITTAGSGSVRLFCGSLASLILLSQSIDKKPGPVNTGKEPMPGLTVTDVRTIRDHLIEFYMGPEGLNRRARNSREPVSFSDRGFEEWEAVAITHAITHGVAAGIAEAERRIREFPEYKNEHPNENPR